MGRERLSEYEARRDFSRTPEPRPGTGARPSVKPRFVVHKHDARRLHYDLRLEIDGVLASWAIPKGPSYDPATKRLAIETEDHPLEYAEFEGRIPEDAYGAGDSLLWDHGTFDTVPPGHAAEQRRRGRLDIELHGEKLRGRWHLVRTRLPRGRPQWLFFKAHDAFADPRRDIVAERPESVVSGRVVTRGPERRQVLEAPRPPPEWLLERLGLPPPRQVRAAVSNGRVALRNRRGTDVSKRAPGVVSALGALVVGDAVLDGELARRGSDVCFVARDLLWLDGEDLRGRPAFERRDLLESLLSSAGTAVTLAPRLPRARSGR